MFTAIFLLPLIPLAIASVIIRVIYVLVTTDAAAPRTPEARRASRSVAIALGLAAVLALAAAIVLIVDDRLGRGLLLAFPAALIVLQLGLGVATGIIGSTVRARESVRIASLSPRTIGVTAPRKLLAATVIGVVIALAFSAIGCATASPDDDGLSRAFASPGEYGGVEITTPFAGSFYAIPAALAIVLSTILAVSTMFGARRWGALDQAELDIALRVGITTRTIAATAMATGFLLVVLGWSLTLAALQVANSSDDSTMWWIGRIGFPLGATYGFILGIWAFLAFLVPTRTRQTGAAAVRLREVRP
ncbi:hypothetical protein LB823_13845 [Tsukamurella sp. M9C]|uniref:hypothetical protein n=1 Tax=Tsukamurella sp. M9C TaxID=2877520 RepID=UPI001CC8F7BA|nr:hypothetical protein [Tsukamurella sp. M9C]MCA0157273.1 hypothetical protein [Tsukamurella sp. M9C]